MDVEVLLFAALRERVGTASLRVAVRPEATVEELVTRLRDAHPALPPIGPACRVAVNETFVPAGTVLHTGDVVALLPPVSGG